MVTLVSYDKTATFYYIHYSLYGNKSPEKIQGNETTLTVNLHDKIISGSYHLRLTPVINYFFNVS